MTGCLFQRQHFNRRRESCWSDHWPSCWDVGKIGMPMLNASERRKMQQQAVQVKLCCQKRPQTISDAASWSTSSSQRSFCVPILGTDLCHQLLFLLQAVLQLRLLALIQPPAPELLRLCLPVPDPPLLELQWNKHQRVKRKRRHLRLVTTATQKMQMILWSQRKWRQSRLLSFTIVPRRKAWTRWCASCWRCTRVPVPSTSGTPDFCWKICRMRTGYRRRACSSTGPTSGCWRCWVVWPTVLRMT